MSQSQIAVKVLTYGAWAVGFFLAWYFNRKPKDSPEQTMYECDSCKKRFLLEQECIEHEKKCTPCTRF